MVKFSWLLALPLLTGCALIDAASGGGDDDDNNDVVIVNNGPNNASNNRPDDTFVSMVCGWEQCGCAYSGCDPMAACTPFQPCRTCRVDTHCRDGDYCTEYGYCGACDGGSFSVPDFYYVGDEEYLCEYDSAVLNPICFLTACSSS